MKNRLGKYSSIIYAVMRIVFGLLYASHGAQKLFGLFGERNQSPGGLILAAGLIEFCAGILIALGLWTVYAAFIASGQMAVAYFMVHQPRAFWPTQNEGELAALYCFAFLYIASRGSGPLSVWKDGDTRRAETR